MRLSLSVLEKYLARKGFGLEDRCDARTGLVLTRALDPATGAELVYPKPVYLFHSLDREACTQRLLAEVAVLEGLTPQAMAVKALALFDLPPAGFVCVRCGSCCDRLADAVRGRVSPEEVLAWQEAGRTDILRFVRRVERPGYSLFLAWVNPRTGRHLARCPWLKKRTGHGCAIHEVKPLKCRAYPLSLESAERTGCRGITRPVVGETAEG